MSSSRRPRYKKQSFESDLSSSDTFAGIYLSMLKHPAFKTLTPNQKILYVYMKAQFYGQKRKPIKDDSMSFTFNQSKWLKGKPHSYELYSNKGQFYKDRDALIEHGLIECVENNRTIRESNVYRFTDRWHTGRPP